MIRMNPSWTRNPYSFAILTPFLHATNFHYVAAILTKVSAYQRTGNTPRDQSINQSINHLFSNAGLQSGSHKADVDLQRTNEI